MLKIINVTTAITNKFVRQVHFLAHLGHNSSLIKNDKDGKNNQTYQE